MNTNEKVPLLENEHEGIIILDNRGSIAAYNRNAADLLPTSKDNLSKQLFTDLFPQDDQLKEICNNKKAFPTHYDVEHKNIRLMFDTITFSAAGEEVICRIKNLQPMQELMEKLQQSELLTLELETIINSSIDEIFVTDGNGKVLRVNPAGEELYGIKEEELIGRYTDELGEAGFYSPVFYPTIIQRQEKVSMIQRTRANKTIHVIGNPVFDDDGNISLIVYTSRDLTEIKHLKEKMERTEFLLDTYKLELEELSSFHDQDFDIVAFSPNMRKLMLFVEKIARVDSTVLITGESGVGKGLIANAIHKKSNRSEQTLVHINCTAIPDSLFESELFGYEGGTFTGAKKEGNKGLFEQADGGALFLDEIGEIPLHFQVKLLKAIQERKIVRVGGSKPIHVDVRIIAATNQDLGRLVKEGAFRKDLYYRLNVIPIQIPPLRTRIEDVSYLIDFFMDTFNKKYGLNTQTTLEIENALMKYSWPGNVRELENIIERLVVTAEKNEISLNDLPDYIRHNESIEHTDTSSEDTSVLEVRHLCTLQEAKEEMEKQLIHKAYQQQKSSYKVGEILGVNQSTALRKIQKYIK
ncbi:sigma 54-interacting transcriptional regulator [Alteribacillus sp. JSM 102045]|uniref:sigma 54-interacting transcriptional regulator n=1 Tax=Alteribacillus sp. JSM 102045 TaxID=1562101 RepID=UPI0035C0218B